MNVLAIDTATEILSVALLSTHGGTIRRWSTVRDEGVRHTPHLMVLIDELLGRAGVTPGQLDLVACMRGPGSFTGLRIGMATAKGLAAAIERSDGILRVVSVPTLECMAAQVAADSVVLPVIDGRKGRYYGACFLRRGDAAERMTPDLDVPADELLKLARRAAVAPGATITVTGPHARAFVNGLSDGDVHDLRVDQECRAGWSNELADAALAAATDGAYDPADTGPVYIRASDAEGTRQAEGTRRAELTRQDRDER